MRVLEYADEAAIRALYRQMLDAWGDANYAACFTPDADYVYGAGGVQHGWQEIIDGHNIVFSAWGRESRLEERIERLRFLTGDVAVLLGYGRVVYLDQRSSDQNKRTVYTLVAQRLQGHWLFASYQNTPLESPDGRRHDPGHWRHRNRRPVVRHRAARTIQRASARADSQSVGRRARPCRAARRRLQRRGQS